MVAKYLSVHDHIDHHQYSSHTRIEMFTFIPQSKTVRTTAIVGKIEIISILCVEEERESICWDWVCWCLESGWCAKWQCPGHLASVRRQLGGDSPPHHGVMPFYRSLLTKYFSGQ